MASEQPSFLHVSTLLSYISYQQVSSTRSPMSSTCPTCQGVLSLPPSIAHLLKTFPKSVTPKYGLNRHILRCKHCDLNSANMRAIEAELPPPSYKNPVTQIEKHMDQARQFIFEKAKEEEEQGRGRERIGKEEMSRALERMEKRRREVLLKIDKNIRSVWEEYWGIWGPEQEGIGALS